MDFGVVRLRQKLISPPKSNAAAYLISAEPRNGSVNLKHQRSDSDDCWKSHKMVKPSQLDFSSNLWPDDAQTMLSFSSSAADTAASAPSIAFSISQDQANSTPTATRGGVGLSGGGSYSKLKGPFTPSQWMELEHQALIYKHIVANVPVPPSLLLPLKRSLYSYGSYASNFLGWGPFHLGFSGSNDPEPGRCRRTDGKKWRCSKDAVPDQKYCERHINRGRHRSRKPVEGLTGHAASKVAPIASSSTPSLTATATATATAGAPASTDHLLSRSQGFGGLSLIPPTTGLKSKDAPPFSIHAPFEESGFGIVPSDCLLNPSDKISYMNGTKEANTQHPVHHFIDDWPKDQSHRASGSWPEELKSDWTQLSMSTSTTSPPQEKSTNLSTHMSLGVSHDEKQSSWSPVIWGNSMGGPLGEVLSSTSTTTTAGAGAAFSSIKPCRSIPHLRSSPTGVLHESTFVSLSNTSSGGSPTSADNKAAENVTLCNDLLGSAFITSATIPSL